MARANRPEPRMRRKSRRSCPKLGVRSAGVSVAELAPFCYVLIFTSLWVFVLSAMFGAFVFVSGACFSRHEFVCCSDLGVTDMISIPVAQD